MRLTPICTTDSPHGPSKKAGNMKTSRVLILYSKGSYFNIYQQCDFSSKNTSPILWGMQIFTRLNPTFPSRLHLDMWKIWLVKDLAKNYVHEINDPILASEIISGSLFLLYTRKWSHCDVLAQPVAAQRLGQRVTLFVMTGLEGQGGILSELWDAHGWRFPCMIRCTFKVFLKTGTLPKFNLAPEKLGK